MKKVLIALAFVTMPVLANPITDAVQEQAWPIYDCVLDVNGSQVQTITDDTQYMQYSISVGMEIFTYTINGDNDLKLVIDNGKGAVGYLYKGKELVGSYIGSCKKFKK